MDTVPIDSARTCLKCGAILHPDDLFCRECGASVETSKKDPFLNSKIRDYEVIEKLGEGGMGQTYLTRHTLLNSYRVIKVMHTWIAQHPDFPGRFHREARLLANLHHPAIVTLHEFSYLDDGTPFMVMEYLKGQTLTEYLINEGNLSIHTALSFILQLCEGLQTAHSSGIIHRDISPENIMLVPDNSGVMQAKLIDFGIAKLSPKIENDISGNGADLKPDTVQTRTGIYVGKPGYGSPEQFRQFSKPVPIDERTDIFSLGIVFYEAIMGHELFSHSGITSYLLSLIRYSEKGPKLLNWSNVPNELRLIIEKCIAYKPTNRYPSITYLIKDLKALLDKNNQNTLQVPLKNGKNILKLDLWKKNKSPKLFYLFTFFIVSFLLAFSFQKWFFAAPDKSQALQNKETHNQINNNENVKDEIIRKTPSNLTSPLKSSLTIEQQNQLNELTIKLENAFAHKKFTSPEKGSVLEIGNKILSIQPSNKTVQKYFQKIINFYTEKGKYFLKEANFLFAKEEILKGLKIKPDNELLKNALEQIAIFEGKYSTRNLNGINFVLIPGGMFFMGSSPSEKGRYDDESPIHRVKLKPFYLSVTEITNSEYYQFCKKTSHSVPMEPEFTGMKDYFIKYPSYPVVNLSWFDAVECAKFYGGRLPTEAEWEYAARGNERGLIYPWGMSYPKNIKPENLADISLQKWTTLIKIFKGYNDGYIFTSPVKSFAPSVFGLYDIGGNVREWCSDWYDKDTYSNDVYRFVNRIIFNPKGVPKGIKKVIRGGSWNSLPRSTRCAFRKSDNPKNYHTDYGLRIAIDFKPLVSLEFKFTATPTRIATPSK